MLVNSIIEFDDALNKQDHFEEMHPSFGEFCFRHKVTGKRRYCERVERQNG